jgi:hypothetical protein
MFYISPLELSLTCLLIALVFVLPLIWKRMYARMDKRVHDLEKKVEKKK